MLPSRVVKISAASADTESIDVSLYETSGEAGEYTCLSYRWGDKLPIRTTTSNLSLFTHGIPWSYLPKTFQDAIQLTRILGLQFIWIDALCIIQDDELDWARESSKMANIYSRSCLTIAAAHAQDCNVGCFVLQDEHPGIRYEIILDQDADGISYSPYVREEGLPPSPTIDQVIPTPTLLSRGWALQERFLSPRVLFFGPQEMFYECNAASTRECGMGQVREDPDNQRVGFRKAISNPGPNFKNLIKFWHELVANYSSMKLTFRDDMLPAISGLAHRLQELTGSEYYAGIWSHSILQDLSWITSGSQQPGPKQYIAPTWSWASTDCPSLYPSLTGDTILASDLLPQVLDISCTLKSSDPFGAVLAGHILIRGLVFEAELRYHSSDYSGLPENRYRGLVVRKDYRPLDATIFRFVPDQRPSAGEEQAVPAGSSILCLLLDLIRVEQLRPDLVYNAATALVLQESPTTEQCFERIGCGQAEIRDKFMIENAEVRTVRII